MIITEIFAVLAISAATGFRIALPLLLIGLFSGERLWANVPILSNFPPSVVIGVLVAWSVLELVLSKNHTSQRWLRSLGLLISPLVGMMAGVAIARLTLEEGWIIALAGFIAGLFALLIQLVQVGWLYRFHQPPVWSLFLEDILCISLVFFAFDAPTHGGLIAPFLLWLALRTSNTWRRWYYKQTQFKRQSPRFGKYDPD